jgi:hypothetical protein
MDIASKLAAAPTMKVARKGPPPACEIYGPGDDSVVQVIEQRRANGETWLVIQRILDEILDVPKAIHNDKFRYHFTKKCGHWDE